MFNLIDEIRAFSPQTQYVNGGMSWHDLKYVLKNTEGFYVWMQTRSPFSQPERKARAMLLGLLWGESTVPDGTSLYWYYKLIIIASDARETYNV